MGHRERVAERIIRYQPEHRAALEQFQRENFGADAPQLVGEHFAWLFDHNPYNDGTGPQLWLYPDGDRVVGQQAGIPFELKVKAGYLRGSWAIDLMVRPEYRLRGIGPVLTEVYANTNDITVGTGLTDLAYTAFCRAGWTDLGYIPLFVRPLDIGQMLDGRGVHGGRRLLANAVIPGITLLNFAGDMWARFKGARFEPVERFDQRVDALWARVSPFYPVIGRRDLRALSWRFDAPPDREHYKRFYVSKNGVVQAYCVLRIGTHHGAKAGFVVDFLCPPRWMTPLFAFCLRYFGSAGVAAVYWQGMHPQARRRLQPLGFFRRSSGAHIMLRITPGPRFIDNMVLDARSWFLTAADSDGDHPRPGQQVIEVVHA